MNNILLKYLISLSLVVICAAAPSVAAAVQESRPRKISLTETEQEWIKNHPVVKIGVEQNWIPFEYFDSNGKYSGISARVTTLIEQYTGLCFQPVTGPWPDTMKRFRQGEIMLLPAVYYDKRRTAYGIYTTPYYIVKNFIFVAADNNTIHDFHDLRGKTVALPKGWTITLKLAKEHPEIRVIETDTLLDALLAVINRRVDATIASQTSVYYLSQQNTLGGIKGIVQTELKNLELSMLAGRNEPILHGIIQKALDSILQHDMIEIRREFSAAPLTTRVPECRLTEKQRKWLHDHPDLRFTGDPDWLPYEAFDKNRRYTGIVADHLKLIEERLNIRFRIVFSSSWEESVRKAREYRVDMLSETTDSKLRSFLIFTESYLSNPIVIIMDVHHSYVESLDQIRDCKIAVIKDYGYLEQIFNTYPDLNFIEVANIQDGITAVSTGGADALLCTMAMGGYAISQMGLNNIKIVGKTGFSTELGFGIRKDYAPLVDIINTAIRSITPEEHQIILNRWIKQKYVEKVDYTLIWQIVVVAALILSGTIFWMFMLKREIRRRITLEEELREKNRQITASIEYASLIQHALIPRQEEFQSFFKDHFIIWEPRDVVGGDLYLMEVLRPESQCLVMMIDCTGHGVPGAFVTMLVKAIERQITAYIRSHDEKVSPGHLLGVMNRSLKHLLRQEDASAISNVGFDASLLFFDYYKGVATYAGAHIPLFYVDNGHVVMIKGNRQSIGYTKSDVDYVFREHHIPLEEDMIFYLATDGFQDQNGGPMDFPMGRKKFMGLLDSICSMPLQRQRAGLMSALAQWQGDNQRIDDITVLGVQTFLRIPHKTTTEKHNGSI